MARKSISDRVNLNVYLKRLLSEILKDQKVELERLWLMVCLLDI